MQLSQTRIEELIRECQKEAQKSIDMGNPPFGCVIIDANGTIVMSAHNTQNTDNDPTAHAEVTALRLLGKKLQSRNFDGYTLFANAESCSMCFSAAIKAFIKTFYFGAVPEGAMNPWLTVHDIAAKATTPLTIHSPILGDECARQIAEGRSQEKRL